MLDSHRRRALTRIVLDNELTAEDCAFMAMATALVEEATPPGLNTHGDTLASAEKRLCEVGEKIPAIKSVRERLSCGLKEAKDMVDAYCKTAEYEDRKKPEHVCPGRY